MTYSMTGFARFVQQTGFARLTYEIRALNHRFLELSFRLSEALQNFEPLLRDELRKIFTRGKFEITIKLQWHADSDHSLPIDQQMLTQLIEVSQRVASQMTNPAPLSPLELLQWPGVLSLEDFDRGMLWQDVEYGFKQSLVILQSAREKEGQAIQHFLSERLLAMEKISGALAEALPELITAQQQRLQKRFSDAVLTLDPERLAQEMVLFAQRLDIAEELSRLQTHIDAVRLLLKESGHGRRLDFLMQELNREANTIGSKSLAAPQTRQVIELKVLIEQMREQIQNVE